MTHTLKIKSFKSRVNRLKMVEKYMCFVFAIGVVRNLPTLKEVQTFVSMRFDSNTLKLLKWN